MSYLSLDPVSAAVYSVLHVAAMTALGVTVTDDVDQATAFPCLLYEVQERNLGGLGTKAGDGRVLQCDLRLHVFSQYRGFLEAQQVMAKAIELLTDPPAVSGYSSWAIFHDETIPVGDVEVVGQKVKELVGNFRLYVQES